ncbi:hypothetical protein [Streptococcus pluranimalium]
MNKAFTTYLNDKGQDLPYLINEEIYQKLLHSVKETAENIPKNTAKRKVYYI